MNDTQNCQNCNKIFKIRGIKLHLRKCPSIQKNSEFPNSDIQNSEIKISDIQDSEIQDSENLVKYKDLYKHISAEDAALIKDIQKNIKKKYGVNYDTYYVYQKMDLVPDDCIKVIFDFLMLKDHHTTYYRLYSGINDLSLSCKKFYINRPNLLNAKQNLLEENDERICKSWCKDMYDLTEDDLSDIPYNVKRWIYTVYLYRLTNIKNKSFEKHGTEFEYKKYKIRRLTYKYSTPKQKIEIQKKNKAKYDELFDNYKKQGFDLLNIYDEYSTYIKKECPRLLYIEKNIIKYICEKDRHKRLNNILKSENIEFYNTNEVKLYLSSDPDIQIGYQLSDNLPQTKYTLENAVISIKDYHDRIKQLKDANIDIDKYSKICNFYIIEKSETFINVCNLIGRIDFFVKYLKFRYTEYTNIKFYEYLLNDHLTDWCKKHPTLDNITFLDVISADILNKIIDIQNKNLLVKTTNRSNHKCDCGGPFAVKCINQKCGNCCHDDKCPRHR
jgi:hypothetical protein